LGIPDATPHAFRRAFATHMLENGANIAELKALLGHADIDSTQYYAKVHPTEMFFSYRKSHPRARRQEDRNEL
jgi:site-specific recombinase XerD